MHAEPTTFVDRAPKPTQLTLEEARLHLANAQVPNVKTPVMRWRKLLRHAPPPRQLSKHGKPIALSALALRAVGTALADHANANGGSCYPRVETLAREAAVSVRTVQTALAALELLGLIERDRRGGRSRSTRYRLACPPASEHSPALKGADGDRERVQPPAPEVRQSRTRKPSDQDRPARVGAAHVAALVDQSLASGGATASVRDAGETLRQQDAGAVDVSPLWALLRPRDRQSNTRTALERTFAEFPYPQHAVELAAEDLRSRLASEDELGPVRTRAGWVLESAQKRLRRRAAGRVA